MNNHYIYVGIFLLVPSIASAQLPEHTMHLAYEDFCEQNRLYNDGFCDTGCPTYDTDCDIHPPEEVRTPVRKPLHSVDFCEQNSLYGDGVCDPGCPKTDTDCIEIIEEIISDVEQEIVVNMQSKKTTKIFGIIPVKLEKDEDPWWRFMLWH